MFVLALLFTAHEGASEGGTDLDGLPSLLTFFATIPLGILCHSALQNRYKVVELYRVKCYKLEASTFTHF